MIAMSLNTPAVTRVAAEVAEQAEVDAAEDRLRHHVGQVCGHQHEGEVSVQEEHGERDHEPPAPPLQVDEAFRGLEFDVVDRSSRPGVFQ